MGPAFQDLIKDRQDWNRDRHAGLFASQRCHPVADILASKADCIAAAQVGVEQHGKPNTLLVPMGHRLSYCRPPRQRRPRESGNDAVDDSSGSRARGPRGSPPTEIA